MEASSLAQSLHSKGALVQTLRDKLAGLGVMPTPEALYDPFDPATLWVGQVQTLIFEMTGVLALWQAEMVSLQGDPFWQVARHRASLEDIRRDAVLKQAEALEVLERSDCAFQLLQEKLIPTDQWEPYRTTLVNALHGDLTEGVQEFRLTEVHLKLLSRMKFYQTTATYHDDISLPIAGRRKPFGNSDVYRDIAEALGFTPLEHPDPTTERLYTLEQVAQIEEAASELSTALQVCLHSLCFQPGLYRGCQIMSNWRRVGD